jgi:hypothetical protein
MAKLQGKCTANLQVKCMAVVQANVWLSYNVNI